MNFLRPFAPQFLSLLRFVVGLLYLEHGTAKHLGFPASPLNGTPWLSMVGVAGGIELVVGTLLVLGLFTRPAAFLASGTMAVAYFTVHLPHGFFPLLNGGELAVFYCFTFLYLAAAGGGPWSLDRLRGAARA